MVATKGGTRLCSGAASHVSLLEDWLYSLVKSFSYWPRRGPRGAWGAEEGLVEQPVVWPAGVDKPPSLLLPTGDLAQFPKTGRLEPSVCGS